MLLRLGATPIRNADDILEALNIGKLDLKSILKKGSDEKDSEYGDCSEKEMQIIRLLIEPLERDEILRQANIQHQISIGETQTLLSLLELKGLIKETMGEIRLS